MENYNAIRDTFKELINKINFEIVNNSEDKAIPYIERHINNFCNKEAHSLIELIKEKYIKYTDEIIPKRYTVSMYEFDERTDEYKKEGQFKTNSLQTAITKAMRFFRLGIKPQVNIRDNDTNTYIVGIDA